MATDTRIYPMEDICIACADAAAALMDCETDEEYEAAMEALEKIEFERDQRALAFAGLLRNLQEKLARQNASKKCMWDEAKRRTAQCQSTERAIDRLKHYMYWCMELAGMTRIRTDIGTWYIAPDVKCKILDAKKVPEEFIKGYTPEVNKAAAIAHFKATGEIIEGLNLYVESEARLR